MDNFKTIKKRSIVEEIIEQLLERITRSEWVAGVQIPSENDLAKMMGVSRLTVRTALQRLIAWDLLEARVGEGTFVKSLTGDVVASPLIKIISMNNKSVVELLQFRRGIEFVTIEVAAEVATDEEIASLGEIVERLREAADSKDVKEYRRVDTEFHSYIARISKISVLESVMRMLRSALADYFETNFSSESIEGNFPYHWGMYEAIKAHDPGKAVFYMDSNLRNLIKKVEAEEKRRQEDCSKTG